MFHDLSCRVRAYLVAAFGFEDTTHEQDFFVEYEQHFFLAQQQQQLLVRLLSLSCVIKLARG